MKQVSSALVLSVAKYFGLINGTFAPDFLEIAAISLFQRIGKNPARKDIMPLWIEWERIRYRLRVIKGLLNRV